MRFRDRAWHLAARALRGAQNHAGLLVVLAVALVARLIYLRWFKVFPPGDVFNFINIALGFPEGTYPPNERRLPFYPLLILLARAVADWEQAALTVAIVASLAALVALYALGRTLGLSKTALTALLLAFQTHPQVLIATRGYADTTLFALLPAALLALLRTRTWKGAVVTGALCGAMALTRYEGLAAALVLLSLWFLLPRGAPSERSGVFPAKSTPALGGGESRGLDGHLRGLVHRYGYPRRHALIGALAFVLSLVPYLLLSAANDRPAFGAGYIAEAQGRTGYGAGNAREFWDSELAIWKRTGLFGAWNIPIAIAREIGEDPLATPRILTARLVEPGEPIALLALLGVPFLLRRGRWRGLLFLLGMTLAASVPPAWFNPLPRYDITVLPLTLLLAASGVTALQQLLERGTRVDGRAGSVVRWCAGITLFIVTTGLWMVTYAEDVRNRQTKHNGRDYAYYQAIHAARALPGNIGFDRDPDIVRLYFGDRAVIFRGPPAGESPENAAARLREQGVRYLVLPNPATLERFGPLLAHPDVMIHKAFVWIQGNNDIGRAAIYRIGP